MIPFNTAKMHLKELDRIYDAAETNHDLDPCLKNEKELKAALETLLRFDNWFGLAYKKDLADLRAAKRRKVDRSEP